MPRATSRLGQNGNIIALGFFGPGFSALLESATGAQISEKFMPILRLLDFTA
ncbi:MAG: hypothetical protein ACLPH3_23970 [Terracidiphilus sp.]